MKIQLTKTKSIEIGGSGGSSKTKRVGLTDVTGVELGSGDPRGCPAVRLTRKKDVWMVTAAGFVPPPDGTLPSSWEESKNQPSWALPPEFQAPYAALTVTSPEMMVRQVMPDALTADLGLPTSADAGKASLKTLKKDVEKKAPAAVAPGVPMSVNGTRFVTAALAEDPFVLQSALPEFQVLWLSRLLPEGKRPTAYSVQTYPSSLLCALHEQPEFVAAGGTAFAVYVTRNAVYLAGFREGALILYRQCPGVAGWEMLREGVKLRLGLDEEIIDSILDDAIVDPRSAMEPFVRPVLQQLELSLDYLNSRHGLRIEKVFLAGLPSGGRYWSQMAEEAIHVPLVTTGVFDGMNQSAKDAALAEMTASQSQVFLAALGAARAAMEVDG